MELPPADYEELEARRTSCLAVLAFAAGGLLTALAVVGLRNTAMRDVDRLVIFNALWPTYNKQGMWREVMDVAVPAMTTRRIMRILLGTSIVVMLASLLGLAGVRTQRKGLVCTYTLVASVLAAWTVMAALELAERGWLATPLIHRQVEDLCNATEYIRLGEEMNCTWVTVYERYEVDPCGEVCAFRAKVLSRLDGCRLLPHLCRRFEYNLMPAGDCERSLADVSNGYGSFVGGLDCQRECDRDISCDAIAVKEGSEHCLLLRGRSSLHKPPQWLQIPQAVNVSTFLGSTSAQVESTVPRRLAAGVPSAPAAGAPPLCFARGIPKTLAEFESLSAYLVAATAVLGATLLVSLFCTCCQMYNINMLRQGKATATEELAMMFCPCCTEDLHDRYHGSGSVPAFAELLQQDSRESSR